MTTTTPPVTLDDVRSAAERLKGVAHRTPVLRSRTLDALARGSGRTVTVRRSTWYSGPRETSTVYLPGGRCTDSPSER